MNNSHHSDQSNYKGETYIGDDSTTVVKICFKSVSSDISLSNNKTIVSCVEYDYAYLAGFIAEDDSSWASKGEIILALPYDDFNLIASTNTSTSAATLIDRLKANFDDTSVSLIQAKIQSAVNDSSSFSNDIDCSDIAGLDCGSM